MSKLQAPKSLTVLESLAAIAHEWRQEGKINRTRVGALAGKSADTVGRFERGDIAPHVDKMVNAIAADAGVSPVDLWMAAINRAALRAGNGDEPVRFATELGEAAGGALADSDGSAPGGPSARGARGRPPKQSR